ncbi:MAG: glycosyltransferase family 2 protein [Prevotella sp.]|nr:glycosyltransferase family 2 protein [Prevotella sp.]
MQNKQAITSNQEAKPLVSFIVTYYNLPVQLLCRCIDSLLALSLRHYEREIIVIDDGSEVSPMNALMQYADDIVYVRQKNGGLSQARNLGIRMSAGRYLQFVDADDWLLQAPYEHCLDIVRYHDDADIVMFDFTTKADVANSFDTPIPVSGTEYMRHNNIHGSACGYIFRRQTLGELRFTPGIWHEDEEFTPQLLLRAEQVYVTSAKAYCYDKRPKSITTSNDAESMDKRAEDRLGVIRRLHTLCDRLPHDDRLALERRVAQLTMDHIYHVMRERRGAGELGECLDALRAEGLFPLPEGDYSLKYKWFRRLSGSAAGLALLRNAIPLMRKER